MSDYECDHCDNFNPITRHCKKRVNCPYDEEEEDENIVDELDLLPKYADALPKTCVCGNEPVIKNTYAYYWVTCPKCRRTTKVYVDSLLGSSESALNRAIKEWNGGGT